MLVQVGIENLSHVNSRTMTTFYTRVRISGMCKVLFRMSCRGA